MFAGMPDFNQSLEMMKTMWGNVAPNTDGSASQGFTMPGSGTSNPFGMPSMNIEDLDKRISELKHVENWLNLNLNVVKTTIQGLEVQRATLAALHAFSDSLKAKTEEFTSETKKTRASRSAKNESSTHEEQDPMAAAGGMAMDMMNNMAQSMSEAMASIPGLGDAISSAGPAKKTTASKTAKPRPRKARASSARRAKGS